MNGERPPPPGMGPPNKAVRTILAPEEAIDTVTASKAVGSILLEQCLESVHKIWNEDPKFATLYGHGDLTKTKRALYQALHESLYYTWAEARTLAKQAKDEWKAKCSKIPDHSPAFVFY